MGEWVHQLRVAVPLLSLVLVTVVAALVFAPGASADQSYVDPAWDAGTARLTFLVPKTAQGKLLKVKVKIVTGKQSALKVVTFKVR